VERDSFLDFAQSNHWQLDRQEQVMNEQTLKGDWMILKGKLKEKWGKLTDDDLDVLEGKRDQLSGTLSKRYGYAKEEAERQIREFNERMAYDARI
jgi:uncharacterized protein YjbJ (UPF0337 family)